MAGASSSLTGGQAPTAASASQPKLRANALEPSEDRRKPVARRRRGAGAVRRRPDLRQGAGPGRQYLQKAVRQGNLDPQYQIWAAWSMVQAGYPEEAEPIVAHLFREIGEGRQPRTLEGTLHLLNAEIHQARHTPEELKKALAEYDRSIAAGQPVNSAMQLRLAQIDVQLGHPEGALKRLEDPRRQGQGGPGAEKLAVLTLRQMGNTTRPARPSIRRESGFPAARSWSALDAAPAAEPAAQGGRPAPRRLPRAEPRERRHHVAAGEVLGDSSATSTEARKLLVRPRRPERELGPPGPARRCST